MKLYKIRSGILLNKDEGYYFFQQDWDTLINRNSLYDFLQKISKEAEELATEEVHKLQKEIEPPVGTQEVWAAGVTYLRSRDARMDESEQSGASDLYDRVYHADRPELFFKSMAHRVAGHNGFVYIRRDSTWNVPEPELTLFINKEGVIQAYTIGNDMSSRSIEGENALYLPQAKIYERSAAIGPCLYVFEDAIASATKIEMTIKREEKVIYNDHTSIDKMKRNFGDLVSYLYRECEFHNGCYLMTGTCLVPPEGFTLQENDEINIEIENIGCLSNKVRFNPNKIKK